VIAEMKWLAPLLRRYCPWFIVSALLQLSRTGLGGFKVLLSAPGSVKVPGVYLVVWEIEVLFLGPG
jgi:hypothetical protein